MTRTRRGGPVHISEVMDDVLTDLWERMRAYRETTGQPMPTPHINDVVRKQREEVG